MVWTANLSIAQLSQDFIRHSKEGWLALQRNPPKKKLPFAKIQMDVSRIPEVQNDRARIDQFGRLLGSLRNTHMTVIGCACVCVRVCVCLIQDASNNSNPPWEKMWEDRSFGSSKDRWIIFNKVCKPYDLTRMRHILQQIPKMKSGQTIASAAGWDW